MNTQLESLKTLREGIASLAPGDQGFAASLIVQYDAKGELTEKQWYWIERLAADVGAGDVPDFTQPAKEIVHVGEFGGVIALFEKAKEYLKYPKITLALPDGSPLQLNLAGKGSKFPGTVGLTDGGSYRRQQMVRQGDEGRRVGARQALRPAEDRPVVDPRPARHPARRSSRRSTASSPATAASATPSSPTRSRRLSAMARSAPSAGACRTDKG